MACTKTNEKRHIGVRRRKIKKNEGVTLKKKMYVHTRTDILHIHLTQHQHNTNTNGNGYIFPHSLVDPGLIPGENCVL